MYIMRDQHIFYLHSLYEVVFKQKNLFILTFLHFLPDQRISILSPKILNFLDLLTDLRCVDFTDYLKYVRLIDFRGVDCTVYSSVQTFYLGTPAPAVVLRKLYI